MIPDSEIGAPTEMIQCSKPGASNSARNTTAPKQTIKYTPLKMAAFLLEGHKFANTVCSFAGMPEDYGILAVMHLIILYYQVLAN